MRQSYSLLLTLIIVTTAAECSTISENARAGWIERSKTNTNHISFKGRIPSRALKARIADGMEDNANDANDEERINLLSFLKKKSGAPKTLQKSPTVANIVQDSPGVAKVVKDPAITRTVESLQKDKAFVEKLQSSRMFSRFRTSFERNPSKKFSEVEIKRMGEATMRSVGSKETWYNNPAWIFPLGILLAALLVWGSLSIANAVNPQSQD